jgi:membrane-associated protein
MDWLSLAWDLAVHLDRHLAAFVAEHGHWVYLLLFVIVFCETGLVVTPFLPGDSLLFAAGTIAAAGGMDIGVVMATLVAAALCGDNVNYGVGRWAGPKVFRQRTSRWFNPRHLARANDFYRRHGGKTIVLARFVPVLRTYVPFVAGVAAMPYARYLAFCVLAALVWVLSLALAGYLFGTIPAVKQNLGVVLAAIVLLSASPGFYAWARARSVQRRG